jgi:hypothetical protein
MRLFRTSGQGEIARIALSWCLLTVPLTPRVAPAAAAAPLCLEQLACMNWCELEQLYRQATPGTIPVGYLCGRAIYCPGAPLSPARSKVSQSVWQGKHFCPADGTLINQWCLGMRAVRARVCYGQSWLDGQPSIVMDYRGMSHVWGNVRDEIREVAPGLYLGLMYRCKAGQPRRKLFFVLQACSCPP